MITAQRRKRRATKAFKQYAKRYKSARAGYSQPVTSTPSIVSTRTGPGNFLKNQFIYSEQGISLDASLTGFSSYQFRTNDIYDPNYTGIGHQPSTHDQMALIFEKYVVYAMDYKITVHNVSSTDQGLFSLVVLDSASTATSFRNVIEQGVTDFCTLGITNSGANVKKFTGHVYNPKVVGKTYKEYITSPQYVTAFGSSPTDPIYLVLYSASANNASTTPQLRFTIELRYHAILMGNNLVIES